MVGAVQGDGAPRLCRGTRRDNLPQQAGICHGGESVTLPQEVTRVYVDVDRSPTPNGIMYASVITMSSTQSIRNILEELHSKLSRMSGLDKARNIVAVTNCLFGDGQSKAQYDNITHIATDLKDAFIYRSFGHIGSSVHKKNTENAFQRCLYNNHVSFLGVCAGHNHMHYFVQGEDTKQIRGRRGAYEAADL